MVIFPVFCSVFILKLQTVIKRTVIWATGAVLTEKVIKKICILGPPGVGKTSLILRFVNDVFNSDYRSTIGAQVMSKSVIANDIEVVLTIWDIAGQNTSRTLSKTHYIGSQGAMLVFDLERKETLDELGLWAVELEKAVGNIPLVLVGNKSDLKYSKAVKDKMFF